MPRIIEVVLFLTPFLGVAVWRVFFPSPVPPAWLIYGLAGFVVLMLAALIWLRQLDAEDGNQAYVPAKMQDGRIIPGHPAGQR